MKAQMQYMLCILMAVVILIIIFIYNKSFEPTASTVLIKKTVIKTNDSNPPNEDLDEISKQLARLECALVSFHEEIEVSRTGLYKTMENNTMNISSFLRTYKRITPLSRDYISTLNSYKDVHTVNLVKNMSHVKDMLHGQYFPVTTTCPVKGKQRKPGNCKYSNQSSSGLHALTESMQNPKPLGFELLRRGTPEGTRNNDSHVLLTFLHIVPNAIVLPEGQVLHKDIEIGPGSCFTKGYPRFTEARIQNLTYVDEVFSISAFWGSGFFHFTIEDLPRIAPSLTFLQKHSNIKIHVRGKASFVINILDQLGFAKERIIQGYIAAKIVYMPAGSRCGNPSTFNIQLLSIYMRNTLFPTARPIKQQKDMNVIIIKRSRKRYFKMHNAIVKGIQQLINPHNGSVYVYNDRHLPNIKDTIEMFNNADIVIGPHGAGLSNLIFSEPGTFVVEGLCYPINMCYTNLAHILGHQYYGVVPKVQCKETEAGDLLKPIEQFIKLIKKMK